MDKNKTERIAESLFSLIQIFHIMRDRNSTAKERPPSLDPGYLVLCFLMHEDLSISKLGRRLQRSKPNMTAIIDRLEKEGKLKRMEGKTDRRFVMVTITDKGRRSMEERKRKVKQTIKKNIASLTRRERDIFCESLENINSIAIRLGRD